MPKNPTDLSQNTSEVPEKNADTLWMEKWKAKKKRDQECKKNVEGGGNKFQNLRVAPQPKEWTSSSMNLSAKKPTSPQNDWIAKWQERKQAQGGVTKQSEKEALLAMGDYLNTNQGGNMGEQRKTISELMQEHDSSEKKKEEKKVVVELKQELPSEPIIEKSVVDEPEIKPVQVGEGKLINESNEEMNVGIYNETEEKTSVENKAKSEEELSYEPKVSIKYDKVLEDVQKEEQGGKKKSFWRVRSEVSGKVTVERPKMCLAFTILFGIFTILAIIALFVERFWVEYSLDQQVLLVTMIFGFVITYGFFQMKVWLPPVFLFTYVWDVGKDLVMFSFELSQFSIVGFFVSFVIQGMILLYLVFKRELFKY